MSWFRTGALFMAVAVVLLQSPAARADVANGERLARQWCANCHVINGSGPSAICRKARPAFASQPAISARGSCELS